MSHHSMQHAAHRRSLVVASPEPCKTVVFPEFPAPTNEFLRAPELLRYNPPNEQRMPSMGEIAEAYMFANRRDICVPEQAQDFVRHVDLGYVWSSTRGLKSPPRLATIGKGGGMHPVNSIVDAPPGTGARLTEGDGPVAIAANLSMLYITADTLKDPHFEAEVLLVSAPSKERRRASLFSRIFRAPGAPEAPVA